jgi:hypothetical protein
MYQERNTPVVNWKELSPTVNKLRAELKKAGRKKGRETESV